MNKNLVHIVVGDRNGRISQFPWKIYNLRLLKKMDLIAKCITKNSPKLPLLPNKTISYVSEVFLWLPTSTYLPVCGAQKVWYGRNCHTLYVVQMVLRWVHLTLFLRFQYAFGLNFVVPIAYTYNKLVAILHTTWTAEISYAIWRCMC